MKQLSRRVRERIDWADTVQVPDNTKGTFE